MASLRALSELPRMVWMGLRSKSPPSPGLPREVRELLGEVNGVVALGGALHVRGEDPAAPWHDVHEVWRGGHALAARYPSVRAGDVPFAESCLGDQFLWRDGSILQLVAETGELEDVAPSLGLFLERCVHDNSQIVLGQRYLDEFEDSKQRLEPGFGLSIYPPLVVEESAAGVSLRGIPSLQLIDSLSAFARQIASLSDGTRIQIRVKSNCPID
jgi:hypothetical protein